jgi:hypothetical protein
MYQEDVEVTQRFIAPYQGQNIVPVHREEALKDLGVSEDALEPIAP